GVLDERREAVAERTHARAGEREELLVDRRAARAVAGGDGPGEVAVDVLPDELRDGRAPVHVPPRDGDAPAAPAVLVDRERDALGVAGALVAVGPLVHVPPVVPPALDDVDLLPRALPHVADPQRPVAGFVEPHPPGVPEAVGPDLVAGVGDPDERVVRRDGSRAGAGGAVEGLPAAVDVEAEEGAEEGGGVLPVVVGVAAEAAVAEGDVEVALAAGPLGRAERDGAGVVVRVR